MNTKNNQRFQNMDRKLKSTLLELLKTMDFEKITVKKICETAQVNRSTFYAHYTDIFDVMNQMEEHLNQELLESYTADDLNDDIGFPSWPFIPFLRHIKKHQYFYKISLQHRKDFPIKQGFEPVWTQIIKPKCEAAGITSENEIMYYFVYFQAGFTMVLKRWVDTGCQESEEEMALTLHKCLPAIWLSAPGSL